MRRLPRVELPALGGYDVRRADTPLARLLGLAGLRELPPCSALLLSRTRSIHTCGMRFALDLVWLDGDDRVVRIDRNVRPWRVRGCRAARAVVELPSQDDA
ncbi:MAG TPA: DUF192 domain-containing protein [Conexibacter sp.]|nr:DUF192 domain-containing protein [Conexibacter sp.]